MKISTHNNLILYIWIENNKKLSELHTITMSTFIGNIIHRTVFLLIVLFVYLQTSANDFSDRTFVVAQVTPSEYTSNRFWDFINENDWVALELDLYMNGNHANLNNSNYHFSDILKKIEQTLEENESKILPVFVNYSGNIHFLDSIINTSPVSNRIFFLPQGETWPSSEYLVQANRRIIFFVQGQITNESRILHSIDNYALEISASQITPNSVILSNQSNINKELFKIDDFENLPTGNSSNRMGIFMVPDYVNFLLDSWTKYGKKPNFISVGNTIYSFDFIDQQLNSFNSVKGIVRTPGKNLERVYWKNPDILITGGKFSFPIRGGEEVILTPFAPGYNMTPLQLIITGEMAMPDIFSIVANPLNLSEGLTAGFLFDGSILDIVHPMQTFEGSNYSFSEDIDRGTVLKLPENANILLGDPNQYGFPNSSFTVSCYVKFTDILEFGDNAILGNDEQGYRRGLHLILRSGHPYFGLWANDYMSEEILKNNIWYHLTWRYIIETGQQAIFLNGKNVGGSDGHPPYSGTSILHLGSALSAGASLRGYIDNLFIWDRPLGNDEINRLSFDEEIEIVNDETDRDFQIKNWIIPIFIVIIFLTSVLTVWYRLRKRKAKQHSFKAPANLISTKNQIQFFGEFKALDTDEEDISVLFTPKVKELLFFTMVQSLRNGLGASISDVDATLWSGIPTQKVANNRAVTLNKLRKLLVKFDSVEIVLNNGFLQLKTSESFFCDYVEAFNLCQIREGMSRQQLEVFFHLVKEGRLLKGTDWPWLDEIRGYIGNQVIDNLLKLASYYQKENKLKDVERVAQRILEYDELSEEAVYLQVWTQQKANNSHMAKFQFESFCSRYEKSMGEKFSMQFEEFIRIYSGKE